MTYEDAQSRQLQALVDLVERIKEEIREKAEQIQAELDAIKAEAAATEEPPPPPVAAENISGADVFAC